MLSPTVAIQFVKCEEFLATEIALVPLLPPDAMFPFTVTLKSGLDTRLVSAFAG